MSGNNSMSSKNSLILGGYILPGLPHPLLVPDANPSYRKLRSAFEQVRTEIENSGAELILIYSTMWSSVLGHQIQGRSELNWTHVDDDFHSLGSIPYQFKFDSEFAKNYVQAGQKRGLHMKYVDYHGFPVDTGSVVALKLLNPNNRIPACIVSSNIYADRAETVVLGKAALDAINQLNKKTIIISISTLSNRLHQTWVPAKEDHIHSLKDQEWNLKMLEFFAEGRLEDLAQLSRQIQKEARVKKVNNFKPLWWMSSVMGAHNQYQGKVYSYEPVHGAGCAVVGLKPSEFSARDLEFDEDSPNFYKGERNVLSDDSAHMSSHNKPPMDSEGDDDGTFTRS